MHQPSVLRFSRARVHDNRAWGSSNRSKDVHISLTGTKVKRARNHDPTEQCDLLSRRSAEEHILTFLPFPPAPGYRPRPFSEIGNSNLYTRVQPLFPSLTPISPTNLYCIPVLSLCFQIQLRSFSVLPRMLTNLSTLRDRVFLHPSLPHVSIRTHAAIPAALTFVRNLSLTGTVFRCQTPREASVSRTWDSNYH